MTGFRALILLLLIHSSVALAAQKAIVIAEKAIVYADQQMTSPLGYIARGKKIRIGDIARNKGQVYPTLVSGKVGYIKVSDVSTETKSVNGELLAERFVRNAEMKPANFFTASLLHFRSNINLQNDSAQIKNKDPINWNGVGIEGGVDISPRADTKVIFNFLQAQKGDERLRSVELGLGIGWKLINQNRFLLEWEFNGLLNPYTQYQVGSLFRVNGYGYGAGTGLLAHFKTGRNWGLNVRGGYYYTKLMGLDLPGAYPDIEPSFTGLRLGVGVSYFF